MANSVDPDQTAPFLGPPCLLLYLIRDYARQLFAADDFSRRLQQTTFSDAFFSWRFTGYEQTMDFLSPAT